MIGRRQRDATRQLFWTEGSIGYEMGNVIEARSLLVLVSVYLHPLPKLDRLSICEALPRLGSLQVDSYASHQQPKLHCDAQSKHPKAPED
jgi:hypothetical protein